MSLAPKMMDLGYCHLPRCISLGDPGLEANMKFGFSEFLQRCSHRDWVNLKIHIKKSQSKRRGVDDSEWYSIGLMSKVECHQEERSRGEPAAKRFEEGD